MALDHASGAHHEVDLSFFDAHKLFCTNHALNNVFIDKFVVDFLLLAYLNHPLRRINSNDICIAYFCKLNTENPRSASKVSYFQILIVTFALNVLDNLIRIVEARDVLDEVVFLSIFVIQVSVFISIFA